MCAKIVINFAGMAELADALDSGSNKVSLCRFKSCYPHHNWHRF